MVTVAVAGGSTRRPSASALFPTVLLTLLPTPTASLLVPPLPLLANELCSIASVPRGWVCDGAPAYWLEHRRGAPLRAAVAPPGAPAPVPALLLQLHGEPLHSPQPPEDEPPVGTRLLLRDDRLDIWQFSLAPGEECAFHRHYRPYVFVNLEVSLTQALDEHGSEVGEPSLQRQDQTTWVPLECLGAHGVRNVGDEPFVQFVVEFK